MKNKVHNRKIAIVSANFMRDLGYQEVRLADSYHRLGYEVKVFTSTIEPNAAKKLHIEPKDDAPYEVLRLKPIFNFVLRLF